MANLASGTGADGAARAFSTSALAATVVGLFVTGALGGGAIGWATAPSPAPPFTPGVPTPTPAPGPSSPTSLASPTEPTFTVTSSPAPTEQTEAIRQQEALDRLESQAAEDRPDFPFDGRWAVQVASKYVGSTDPFQQPESGDTYQATDIWSEYSDLKAQLDPPYTVKLLHRGNKVGANTGQMYWYTFVTDDFGSKQAAKEFCNDAFRDLPRAERDNQCLPRQLPRS